MAEHIAQGTATAMIGRTSENDPSALKRNTANRKENRMVSLNGNLARVFCQAGGLLKRHKGKFVVPQKNRRLLDEDRAGHLYRFLFVSFFRKFNLGHLVNWAPDLPSVQRCAAYTLYRLGFAAREWHPPTVLYQEVFLPGVRQEVDLAGAERTYFKPSEVAARLVIHPLIKWNLLEARMEKTHCVEEPVAVRVSPLYDPFFRFRL